MARPKESTRPPKKQKAKAANPETEQEFQEAADLEEETGGKWRAGDPAKSGRAFVRALEIYDKALQRHPKSFDLAYNKARLELEITQRPALVAHIGLPIVDLLKQTLESHRYALRSNEENPDVLFNTSQVLTALAEQFLEGDEDAEADAVRLLQEALEVLSACLSRQEMLLEQQKADFEEAEEGGGVSLDPDEKPMSTPQSEDSGELATIESPVTPSDLLDTVQASLSALTTLVSVADAGAIQTYGDMAQTLTEVKAPAYIAQMPPNERDATSFQIAIDRATFIAAFADAQFNAFVIEAETYLARLDAFDIPGKDEYPSGLQPEAGARLEFSKSVILRFDDAQKVDSSTLPAEACWKQLSAAQTGYGKAAKLEQTPEIYLSRGDTEMLRHRIASPPNGKISDAIRKSAPTLAQNAETYYRGAVKLAGDEEELRAKASERQLIAALVRGVLYGVQPDAETEQRATSGMVSTGLESCVEDGLLDQPLAEKVMQALAR